MSLLLWLLGGVVLGVGGEQIVHRLRPPDLAPGGPRNRDPGTGRPRPRSRRRVVLISVGVVALVLVVSGIGIWLWASSVFNRIERVAVGPALSDGGRGTNYLLVGTDNRAGVAGNRSDTILLLRIEGGKARMLSIPRDLYVTIANTGKKQRINAAYNSGAINLVRTVTAELGLPVDRYLEVNFVSFGGLVDAVGGVDIDFPNPAFDRSSGLDVKQAGRVRLDGKQALAYVRSRHFVEIVNGQEKSDPGGDLSREQRQQTFLARRVVEGGRHPQPVQADQGGIGGHQGAAHRQQDDAVGRRPPGLEHGRVQSREREAAGGSDHAVQRCPGAVAQAPGGRPGAGVVPGMTRD